MDLGPCLGRCHCLCPRLVCRLALSLASLPLCHGASDCHHGRLERRHESQFSKYSNSVPLSHSQIRHLYGPLQGIGHGQSTLSYHDAFEISSPPTHHDPEIVATTRTTPATPTTTISPGDSLRPDSGGTTTNHRRQQQP